MRAFISCLLIVLLSWGLVIQQAEARRFGGGRSFGVQRSHSSLFSGRTAPRHQGLHSASPRTHKWGGMLGGLLAGGLLASLFMGHGLGSGLISWLIVGSLIYGLITLLRKRTPGVFQQAQAASSSFTNASPFSSTGSREQQSEVQLNTEEFLRAAKVTFYRLQAAYDQKNLHDLVEFTAPDVFAEIKMQLDERGETKNHTEIVSLETILLDVSKQAHGTLASVHFKGFIKEDDAPMIALDEIWHFRQFSQQDNWVVAGIQQPQ